ncbi:MAG: BPL-N domain-containing protein [Bacteriovorax sp.]|nr:BPL-N domain-containing protein [Bacteriovorax sp.]
MINILLKIIFFLSCAINLQSTFASEVKYAVVYNGKAACDGCAQSAARIAKKLGLKIKYVKQGEISVKILTGAAVYIQPGGPDDLIMDQSFSESDVRHIRDYVFKGGRYWGICAGGYLAAETLVEPNKRETKALGLIPGIVYDYSEDKTARMELVTWNGQNRWLYFQDAPAFKVKKEDEELIIPLARYQDGVLAAFTTHFGLGKVLVAGPHTEATQDWYDEDHLVDPDGIDNDLAILALRNLLK